MSNNNNPLCNAVWIGAEKETVSPIILRSFMAEKCKKAELIITSLGFFEAKINNKLVTDQFFLPVVTDYEKRDMQNWLYPIFDTLTHRLYYYTFDITSLLNDGENVLSVHLGNGWYRQTERIAEGQMAFGDVLKAAFCIRLETENGSVFVFSDGTELWGESEITYSNLFIGEVIDYANVQYPCNRVHVFKTPDTELCEAIGTPDRMIRTVSPVCIGESDGRKIYDAGENISGLVRVNTSAKNGERISIRLSEEIYEDGRLDFSRIGGGYHCSSGKEQIQADTFICDGTSRTFMPKFVWHAFRYFEIEGDFDSVEVVVIHSDASVTSSFESESEGFNFLYDAFIRSQLGNMHGSVPSDCPHRERLGYTGDGQVCAPAVMMLLETKEFYRKWIQDILDCQCKVSGHVQHTAPMMGGGGGPGGWGCAIVTVPYAYYKYYGDKEMLEKTYEPMCRWVEYLKNHSENGLVVREEKGGWCLGDWCTREKIAIPEPFVNTCFFIKILRILCEIARIINKPQDISAYEELICTLVKAVEENYKNESDGTFCNGIQGADAYAVWAGLADENTVKKLAEKYDVLGYFDTGFIATDILCSLLTENGYTDTFLKLLDSEEFGSYLFMKRHGATTVWENWDGGGSHNHPMFGACVRYLFTGVLGISQAETSVAFEDLVIAPKIPGKLQFARGKLVLPCGEVSVGFEKTENGIEFSVCIPQNKQAIFVYNGITKVLAGGLHTFAL